MSAKICPGDAKRRALKTLIKLAENAASQVMLDSARAETNKNAAPPGPAQEPDHGTVS